VILAEQVYMIVRQELFNNNITAYSDHVPDETHPIPPFVLYEITNLDLVPDWAFEKDYEKLRVRFNIYGARDNPMDAIDIAEEIEGLFNRVKNSFLDPTEGKYLICSYKVNDSVNIIDDPKYWLTVTDYDFECQRDI